LTGQKWGRLPDRYCCGEQSRCGLIGRRPPTGRVRVRSTPAGRQPRTDGHPSLATLSARLGGSPYHLQRNFKRLVGVTPREYSEAVRLRTVKGRLRLAGDITGAMLDAGYGSSSRFYERAVPKLGMSPSAYRRGGAGMSIKYTIVDSPLGRLLVVEPRAPRRRQLAPRLLPQHGNEPLLGQEPADEAAQSNETADLLEALRRRRGERETANFDDDQATSVHPSAGGIRLIDVPLEGYTDSEPSDEDDDEPELVSESLLSPPVVSGSGCRFLSVGLLSSF